MDTSEFNSIVMVLNASYSTNGQVMIKDKEQAQVWYTMLKDLDGDVAKQAVINLVARSSYQPKIADIRREYARLTEKPMLGESEAWALVRMGIRNGIYGAEEEFAALPETVQTAVGNPANLTEWAMLPGNEVETVIQSHFLKAYRAAIERKRDNAVIGAIGAEDGKYAALIAETIKSLGQHE